MVLARYNSEIRQIIRCAPTKVPDHPGLEQTLREMILLFLKPEFAPTPGVA